MNTIEIKKRMNRRSRGAVALAFILPFVLVAGAAVFLMSCSNPTGGDTKVTTVDKTLMLGDFPITVEYKSNVFVAQADLDKIQNRLDYLDTSITPSDIDVVNAIKARGNTKIVIENVPEYSDGNDYRIIDGHSFAIRSEWLSTATNGQVYYMLIDGYNGIFVA